MITQVTIEGFKLLREKPIPLSRVTTVVGPNNGGKTSFLQALLVWQLALQTWVKRRKYDPTQPSKLKAKERTGLSLTLDEFTFMEVASTYELWPDLVVYSGPNQPSLIKVQVDGVTASKEWSCSMEIQHRDARTVLVRPVQISDEGLVVIPPEALREVIVSSRAIHGSLPTNEMLLQREGVDFNVQIGEANRALRSMLYWLDCGEGREKPGEEPSVDWQELVADIQRMFDVELQRPSRLPNSVIEVTYRNRRNGRKNKYGPSMNLNTAGSGFLQILQLLTLFHSRRSKATLFLLDEPEAHLESIRQQELYRLFAQRAEDHGFQVVMASHSERIMEEAFDLMRPPKPRQHLLMLVEGEIRTLTTGQDKKVATQAIADIPAGDYYATTRRPRWLYIEGKSDVDILREWARVLSNQEALRLLEAVNPKANHHYLKTNSPVLAFRHFEGLRFIHPEIKGVVLTDHVDKEPNPEATLVQLQWPRREIENYLLVWDVIERVFWAEAGKNKKWPEENNLELFRGKHAQELRRLFTEKFLVAGALEDENHPDLKNKKASEEILEPFFKAAFQRFEIYNPLPKENFYLLAAAMKPVEVHADVREMLEKIVTALC